MLSKCWCTWDRERMSSTSPIVKRYNYLRIPTLSLRTKNGHQLTPQPPAILSSKHTLKESLYLLQGRDILKAWFRWLKPFLKEKCLLLSKIQRGYFSKMARKLYVSSPQTTLTTSQHALKSIRRCEADAHLQIKSRGALRETCLIL